MFAPLDFNIFSLSLILTGGFAFILAAWIMRKRRQTFNWFSLMLIAAAWWSVCYGFELAASNLKQMLFWIKLEYLGIVSLPSLWLIFSYSFIGRQNRLNNLTFISLFSYSAVTYLMVLTNESHHLFYQSTSIDSSGPFPLLSIEAGPWYKIHTVIFYALVIAGYWALITHLRHAKSLFRNQNRLLIIGTLIPLLVNVGYIFLDFRPFGHIDLTPLAFLITSFIIAVGLMRFGLFDISPMARAKVIQELNDGLAVLDARGRLIDFNTAFEAIIESEKEPFGYTLQELLPVGMVEKPLPQISDEGFEDFQMNLKDGRVFEVSATSLTDKSGLFNGSAILFKDISTRIASQKALEEKTRQLFRLNELKNRLFSIIAHDLRGPLLNLRETMHHVNSGLLTTEERDSILEMLEPEVEQSVGLMQNLLDWAQSQQKGETLDLTLFDTEDLCREALKPLMASIKRKKQILRLELEEKVSIYADRERLKIVLRNLANNAVKFTPEEGQIHLWTKAKGDQVTFYIEDNGMGLTERQLQDFNKEAQLESTFGTKNEKGSGLGLMLVRDFLRQHGSHLQIESQLGFGAKMYFSISRVPDETHPSDPELYKYQ